MNRRISLKLATSMDSRIAAATGESRWITGPEARKAVHDLRAAHQAVLVGVDTVIADDPALTVRLDDFEGPQPHRIVLDSRQRIPITAALVATAKEAPTILITTHPCNPRLTDAGVTVLEVAERDGRVDLSAALEALKGVGVERVLVEGGGQVAGSFIRAGLVDAIEWFRAPILLGDDGRPAVDCLGLQALADAPRFRLTGVSVVGEDLWERYERG
jgi:diaminohydroxyphosphoribosylaminopyrimidine deaminase/5-amino-6-(5-phosphoribosylamino)uracil reductase